MHLYQPSTSFYKSFPKVSKVCLTMVASLSLLSCSNGDSSVTTGTNTPAAAAVGTGVATVWISKGPVTGSLCYLRNLSNNILAGPVLSVNGVARFTGFDFLAASSVVRATCSGGTYTDEATGNTFTLGELRGAGSSLGNEAGVIITPFTEMAMSRSAVDLSDYSAQIGIVESALGLAGLGIASTIPTDVNTQTADNSPAGKYGTALAAFSQLAADKGQSAATLANTLAEAITDNVLDQVLSDELKNALAALPNSSVANNINTDALNDQYDNLAKSTPSIAYVLPGSFVVTPAAPIGYNTNVTFTGSGGSLDLLNAVVVACFGPAINIAVLCDTTITNGGTNFSATCLAPATGATAIFSLNTTGDSCTGEGIVLNSDTSYTLTGMATGASTLTSVTPLTSNYEATQTYTFTGTEFPNTGFSATLGGRACTLGGTSTQMEKTFNCTATADRGITEETIALLLPNNVSFANNTVTYTPSPVTITTATPNQVNLGDSAPAAWAITGTGLYTGLVFSFNGSECADSGMANATGTAITINCANTSAPTTGASTNLTVAGMNLPATGNTLSIAIVAATVTSVSPTAVNYSSLQTFTVIGANFPQLVTATLGTTNCTPTGAPTATSLTFDCQITGDRNITEATFAITIPGAALTLDTTISYSAPPVILTLAAPSFTSHASAAPASWTVEGSGLHDGLIFSFNNINCANSGVADSDGTRITSIDCSNITSPDSGFSAPLRVTSADGMVDSLDITFNTLPAANLLWNGGSTRTVKINSIAITTNAFIDTTQAGCTGSTILYEVVTVPASGVVAVGGFTQANGQFTITPGGTPGVATVTATTLGTANVCAANTSDYVLTVSELDPVELTFASDTVQGTLGVNTSVTRPVTASIPTNPVPSIVYSIDTQTPAGISTINANTGEVTIVGAGTTVVTATGSAANYADGTASYTIIIGKANAVFSDPDFTSTPIGVDVSHGIMISAPAGLAFPAITGGPIYSIRSVTGIATISASGLITPIQTGTVDITVDYAGDNNYNSTAVLYPFLITQGEADVTWQNAPANVLVLGDTQAPIAMVSAVGTGPEPTPDTFTYTSTNDAIISISNPNNNPPVLTAVAPGTATVRATYDGDTNYLAATSFVETEITVNQATPTIAFSTANPAPMTLAFGASADIASMVTGVLGAPTPTGTVTYSFSGGTNGGSITGCAPPPALDTMGVTALCTITAGIVADSVNIIATYSGDVNYLATTVRQTVIMATGPAPIIQWTDIGIDGAVDTGTTNIDVTPTIAMPAGTTIDVRISVVANNTLDQAPTGSVIFTSSNTGVISVCTTSAVGLTPVTVNIPPNFSVTAACTLTNMSAGTADITATYSGDSFYVPSAVTTTVTAQ